MNIKSILLPALTSIAALAISFSANATTLLTNQYTVNASAVNVGVNEWQFNYSVLNNNQGLGGRTGLDGLTLFVPENAVFVSATNPASYFGWPGSWSHYTSAGLDLWGNGSQNLPAPAGYTAFTWWGADPASVYIPGSTANFSVTLSNVSVGNNTIGLSTYFGFGQPSSEFVSNMYGNYSTFVGEFVAPTALTSSVPETNAFALLMAGLGLLGFAARRRAHA